MRRGNEISRNLLSLWLRAWRACQQQSLNRPAGRRLRATLARGWTRALPADRRFRALSAARLAPIVSVAALLVLGAMVGPVNAQPPPRDQTDAAIGDSVTADHLLMWSEDRGTGYRIYGKRIRSNGWPVGGADDGERELTGPTRPGGGKGDQRWPAMRDGLLVWSERTVAGDFDLFAQRMAGWFGRGDPKLIAGGPGDQKYADVLSSSGGGREWFVVWSEDTRDAGDVMGVRLSTTLGARGPVIEIAKGVGIAEDPTIALEPEQPQYALVLWTDDRKGNLDVFGTRIAATGLPRGGASAPAHFAVIDTPEDDYSPVLRTSGSDGSTPGREVGNRDARYFLLWTHDDVADGPDVVAARLAGNGYMIGTTIDVASGPGTQKWPAIAPGDGSALTVWHADPLGTLDLFGTFVEENGLVRQRPRLLVTD